MSDTNTCDWRVEFIKVDKEKKVIEADRDGLRSIIKGQTGEIERLKGENEKLRIIDKYRRSPTPWLITECDRYRELYRKARQALEIISRPALGGKLQQYKAQEALSALDAALGEK